MLPNFKNSSLFLVKIAGGQAGRGLHALVCMGERMNYILICARTWQVFSTKSGRGELELALKCLVESAQ